MLTDEFCRPAKGEARLEADAVQALLPQIPGWSVSEDGLWLQRHFSFADFTGALAFVNAIAPLAEAENHHPDIELGWGYVRCKLQTHDVGGLHRNDFILAAKFNAALLGGANA